MLAQYGWMGLIAYFSSDEDCSMTALRADGVRILLTGFSNAHIDICLDRVGSEGIIWDNID